MALDLPTRLDLYALARDYLLSRAAKLDPGQVDVLGSDANLFVGSVSVVSSAIVNQLAFAFNRLTLSGADGDDLDRLAFDRYGLTRKGASPAVGAVRIFRASNAGGAGTVAIGTKVQTLTGIEYLLTSSASFGASDLTSQANVRAAQAGKATQAAANTIARFSDPSTLFDRTLQVNNDLTTAGGEDAEDDATFRARIRNFWNTARRGILAAIAFGATSVPGVVTAQAVEALAPGNMPARVVNLYIADSSGVASQALADQVRSALDDFRAGGIAVLISTSIPLIVQVQLHLSFQANVDTVSLTEAVRGAVVAFVNNLPVNGPLYLSDLYSTLQTFVVDGLIVNQATIVAPVGDLVPPVGQTIRTTFENVTSV
jgi:uncharacterized phage protein gp47/JayE